MQKRTNKLLIKVQSLKKKGKSNREIGRLLGVADTTIGRWLLKVNY